MRKILLLIACGIILLFSGFVASKNRYHCNKFSIEYPQNWTINQAQKTNPIKHGIALILKANYKVGDANNKKFSPNFNIEFGKATVPFDKMIASLEKHMTNNYNDFHIEILDSNMKIDGYPTVHTKSTLTMFEQKVENQQYFIAKDNAYYILTLSSLEGSFEQDKEAWNTLISSFKFS